MDDAEVVMATWGGGLDPQRLDEPVRQARSAAADAARVLAAAERVADR